MQIILSLMLGLLAGLVVGGAVVAWFLAQQLRKRLLPAGTKPARLIRASRRDRAWFRGDDLLRYPRRLGELQARLCEQQVVALDQASHLHERGSALVERPDRQDLAHRYGDDAELLERRADRMGRVLGEVWKTRALLFLRAHVAITARRRPVLDGLPQGEIPFDKLLASAAAYDAASEAVQAFVDELDSRANDVGEMLPPPPAQAFVTEALHQVVEGERMHTLQTYQSMRARMDELADTLVYLADRCRTRAVVEGGPAPIEGGPGSDALMAELDQALGGLSELAEVGDRQLADAAMDKLANDISQLERAGLDAQAETDAVLEVQRLLEQFPKGS